MKQKLLLMLAAASFIYAADAQKKGGRITAYAITAAEKGGTKWAEVKLIDMTTGEEIQSVYQGNSTIQPLNARTKNAVKKEQAGDLRQEKNIITTSSGERLKVQEIQGQPGLFITTEPDVSKRKVIRSMKVVYSDAPFETNSAACAYDKKHDRLYYTPMGINQLRYIDLKEKAPAVYYFEDEPLGALSGPNDVQNQVTRMVIASDGNGYALTNNADHLVQFTTNKKAAITDLGKLTDDGANGAYSIHSLVGYGGDMVADDSKNLYIVTGNKMVFKVSIKTLVATYKGTITGLPAGYTTNGAAVDDGNTIIVTSSTNTSAYYKFSLDNMQAEKISTGPSVFNASDLANGNLISEKKKKPAETKPAEEIKINEQTARIEKPVAENAGMQISIYPNPVSTGQVKISFEGYETGVYELQLVDINGKFMNTQTAAISAKSQLREYNLPAGLAKGTYLLKVVNSTGKAINIEKIIVQ